MIMNIVKCNTYEKMCEAAATVIAAQIITKPDSVLGLATGGTPLGVYSALARMHWEGMLDFSQVKTFNLDEYIGIGRDHDQSYYFYMNKNLFSKINIKKENINIMEGITEDVDAVCAEYEMAIKASGGIDLQLLGIGGNGHIGFNEPGDFFPQETHLVELAESTIDANSRFFPNKDDVPKTSITMGIGSIMRARKILVVASGAGKAEILARMVYGKVSPQLPASILQFHSDVTVITDTDAGSMLT